MSPDDMETITPPSIEGVEKTLIASGELRDSHFGAKIPGAPMKFLVMNSSKLKGSQPMILKNHMSSNMKRLILVLTSCYNILKSTILRSYIAALINITPSLAEVLTVASFKESAVM